MKTTSIYIEGAILYETCSIVYTCIHNGTSQGRIQHSAQTDKLKAFAKAKIWQLQKVYTDPGFSGAKWSALHYKK